MSDLHESALNWKYVRESTGIDDPTAIVDRLTELQMMQQALLTYGFTELRDFHKAMQDFRDLRETAVFHGCNTPEELKRKLERLENLNEEEQ